MFVCISSLWKKGNNVGILDSMDKLKSIKFGFEFKFMVYVFLAESRKAQVQ